MVGLLDIFGRLGFLFEQICFSPSLSAALVFGLPGAVALNGHFVASTSECLFL